MKPYIKKPFEVKAFQFDGTWQNIQTNIPNADIYFFHLQPDAPHGTKQSLFIEASQHKWQKCNPNDYVIQIKPHHYQVVSETEFINQYETPDTANPTAFFQKWIKLSHDLDACYQLIKNDKQKSKNRQLHQKDLGDIRHYLNHNEAVLNTMREIINKK